MEKWQEGIKKWDCWSEATQKARAEVMQNHGNLVELVNRAVINWSELEEGTQITAFSQIQPTVNTSCGTKFRCICKAFIELRFFIRVVSIALFTILC